MTDRIPLNSGSSRPAGGGETRTAFAWFWTLFGNGHLWRRALTWTKDDPFAVEVENPNFRSVAVPLYTDEELTKTTASRPAGEPASDDLVAEIRAGLEGVTPGPWHLRTLENFGWNVVCYRDGDKFDIVRVAKAGDEAVAAHIARMSPENVAALLARLDAAEPRVKAEREFIAWVDTWASRPVEDYSLDALDGLFAMARDRIRILSALEPSHDK